MSLAALNFDAKTVEPSTGFDPLPDGEYLCMVEKAEEKKTKKGDGEYLNLQLKVMEGKYAKRVVFDIINLQNPSSKTVEIGRAQLSAFCRATGVLTPKVAHEFANRMVKVTLRVTRRQDNNQLTNKVDKYAAPNSAVAGLVTDGTSKASQPAQAVPSQQAAPAPWAKA